MVSLREWGDVLRTREHRSTAARPFERSNQEMLPALTRLRTRTLHSHALMDGATYRFTRQKMPRQTLRGSGSAFTVSKSRQGGQALEARAELRRASRRPVDLSISLKRGAADAASFIDYGWCLRVFERNRSVFWPVEVIASSLSLPQTTSVDDGQAIAQGRALSAQSVRCSTSRRMFELTSAT
jgi:hypothetical protein